MSNDSDRPSQRGPAVDTLGASANRCLTAGSQSGTHESSSRRAASPPVLGQPRTDVRTSRSVKPNGAASWMRLPRVTTPPLGPRASPNIVTSSDPP